MDMATRMAEDGFKDVGYKYVSIDVRFDNFWLKFIIICRLVYYWKITEIWLHGKTIWTNYFVGSNVLGGSVL